MKNSFYLFCTLLVLGLSSCFNSEGINYKKEIKGVWVLTNIADLQVHFKKAPFSLSNASLEFQSDGTLIARLTNKELTGQLPPQEGEWEMPINGKRLIIRSDSSLFNDELKIAFKHERMFYLYSNGATFRFEKR
jgi:hypothetical protein